MADTAVLWPCAMNLLCPHHAIKGSQAAKGRFFCPSTTVKYYGSIFGKDEYTDLFPYTVA